MSVKGRTLVRRVPGNMKENTLNFWALLESEAEHEGIQLVIDPLWLSVTQRKAISQSPEDVRPPMYSFSPLRLAQAYSLPQAD